MAAMLRAASRALLSTFDESEMFKQLVMFCAAGLLVSVVSLSYGLDLSAGFF
jgi:hypothetical protein